MHIARTARLTLLFLLALSCPVIMAAPPGAQTWPVTGRLLGKDGKKSVDVSGIACTAARGFPRSCLAIDDNLQSAHFVTIKDGELIAGDQVPLIENTHKGKPLELDGEGVAYADGFYYVMGSHGHPRDKAKKLKPKKDAAKIKARIIASSQIIRVTAEERNSTAPVIARTGKLRDIIAADATFSRFADRRLENNGLTIEGIAVSRGRLLAGFRGPTLENGRAAVLSVA